jgi:peptidoglycan hydrolase-like protein with peptidoglycan-binding domain
MNKKIIAFILAGMMLVSVGAPARAEVTIESLQEQIASLTALINTLQAQLAGQTSTPSTGAVCFYTDLEQGMTSAEVLKLQQTLNLDPATRVAASGAGAPGSETTYFGSLTLAAAKAFQAKHGIITTGYVGPLTRAQLNALYCTPTTPTTAPGETTTTTVAPSYGSLSVVSYPVSNPVTTVYGGQTYELVAGQYKATGSDMTIRKVSVKTTSGSADVFPWQAFSTISVWDGSTKLAELPVTQTNAIENTFASVYTFDISGLDLVVSKDTQKVLTVKATVVPSVSSAVASKTFTFSLLVSGVVSNDTAGVTYTSVTGSDLNSQSVTISAAQTATFTVTAAADNPKTGNVIGSTSATTRVEVLKFNVKNNTDVVATFNSGTITATSSNATTTVSVELWDGEAQIASAAPAVSGAVTWSNFTLPVAGNTTKTLTVKAVIAQLATDYAGGDTVTISTGPVLSGIDGNSNVASANGAAVTGAAQSIYLTGPIVSLSTTSFDVTGSTSYPASIGKAKIVFSITAAGTSDVYIGKASSATSTITPTPASASSSIANGFTCTSGVTADSTTGWRITAGNTGICELNTTIQLTGTYAGAYYQVAAKEIYWGTSTGSYGTKYTGNLSDFITSQGYLSY